MSSLRAAALTVSLSKSRRASALDRRPIFPVSSKVGQAFLSRLRQEGVCGMLIVSRATMPRNFAIPGVAPDRQR
jgi:hypothetical protein